MLGKNNLNYVSMTEITTYIPAKPGRLELDGNFKSTSFARIIGEFDDLIHHCSKLELALLLKSDDLVFHRVHTTLHFKQFC